jgi:hypothetical protein
MMKFLKERREKKEEKKDVENYFRNMVIANSSDFDKYCNFLSNNKIINFLKRIIALEIGVIIILSIVAYHVLR